MLGGEVGIFVTALMVVACSKLLNFPYRKTEISLMGILGLLGSDPASLALSRMIVGSDLMRSRGIEYSETML